MNEAFMSNSVYDRWCFPQFGANYKLGVLSYLIPGKAAHAASLLRLESVLPCHSLRTEDLSLSPAMFLNIL